MEQDNRGNKRPEPTYSTRVKAGRRRTYFIDVRPTRDEFYITITESKKRNDDTYEKHKIFIYKEDFNKFLAGLTDTINHIKTELMPGADFEQYDRKDYNNNNSNTDNMGSHQEEQHESNFPESSHDGSPSHDGLPSNDGSPSSPAPETTSDEDLKW